MKLLKEIPRGINSLRFPIETELFSGRNLIFSFSSRQHGNMSLSYGETRNSLKNRKDYLANLGINYADLVCARQVHGNSVACVDSKDRGRGALSCDTAITDTDGIITSKKGLPLAIFTADCLSAFLYEPRCRVIGLIHAGWRSTKGGIIPKAVQLMQDKYKINPGDVLVKFGPSIRQCCYEVGSEFTDFFPGNVAKKEGKFYLDLAGVNNRQLLDSGIKETNIYDSLICTSCRADELFSFRKEGDSCGRMMSVAMLV